MRVYYTKRPPGFAMGEHASEVNEVGNINLRERLPAFSDFTFREVDVKRFATGEKDRRKIQGIIKLRGPRRQKKETGKSDLSRNPSLIAAGPIDGASSKRLEKQKTKNCLPSQFQEMTF